MNNKVIRYLKTITIIALLTFFASCAGNGDSSDATISQENDLAEQRTPQVTSEEVFGMADWGTGEPKPIHMVTCGFDGHGLYSIWGRGELFSVRVEFPESDGEVDFENPQDVILNFERDHEYGPFRFHMLGSMGMTGEVSASLEGASGEAVLQYSNLEIDGSLLTYDLTCSHDRNRRRL
ncbi:MAG: hypothetical protein EA391_03720 [Balneolaceae bacterium]|nr:MAG: hypothetical protein EA391_03720 [Balneolaceae bacterium]